MDTDTLITVVCLVVAVIVFLQLRSVLGKRTGFERPRADPIALKKPVGTDVNTTQERMPSTIVKRTIEDDYNEIDKIVAIGSPLNEHLRSIRQADGAFNAKEFLNGARIAYEMIVTAFANGDLRSLKSLVNDKVYDGFSKAVDERRKKGETVKFSFIGVKQLEYLDAELDGEQATITLRVVSEMISATFDKNDTLVDGDEEAITVVHDRWTFSRNIQSTDPTWLLTATEEDI